MMKSIVAVDGSTINVRPCGAVTYEQTAEFFDSLGSDMYRLPWLPKWDDKSYRKYKQSTNLKVHRQLYFMSRPLENEILGVIVVENDKADVIIKEAYRGNGYTWAGEVIAKEILAA